MVKPKKDTPSFSFPVMEEGETPEIITNTGKSSEDLAKEIDAARQKEIEAKDTATDLTFKPAEDVVPPEPTKETAPEKDTAEEKTAIERLKEKKGYKDEEEIAKAYEELETFLGRRDGYVPSEKPPESQPGQVPPPESGQDFTPFWDRFARNPIQTLNEAVEQANISLAERFQNQFREVTQRRLAFEMAAEKKLPYWKDVSGDYNRNLQLGMNFGEAFERAELNYLRGQYKRGYAKGLEETTIKQEQAANAEIEGSVASPPKEPKEITPDEFGRLSLEEMERLLPHKY